MNKQNKTAEVEANKSKDISVAKIVTLSVALSVLVTFMVLTLILAIVVVFVVSNDNNPDGFYNYTPSRNTSIQ